MRFNKNLFAILFAVILTLVSVSASSAQDTMKHDDAMKTDDSMKKDAMMKDDGMKKDDAMAMMDDHRPVVATIEADWCPYCKRVDPVIAGLKKDYATKFNFVSFDVTDEKAIAASKAKAEALGLNEFFNNFKGKTSAVVVIKDKKIVFKTFNNDKKSDYIKAFDEAAK